MGGFAMTTEGSALEDELEDAARLLSALSVSTSNGSLKWVAGNAAARLRARAEHVKTLVDAFEKRPQGAELVLELLRALTGPIVAAPPGDGEGR